MKKLAVILFCFLSAHIYAQDVFKRKFDPKSAMVFDITVKRQYPGGDLVDRFGKNASLGLDLSYKTKSNWFFTLGGHFMFGKVVNEIGIAGYERVLSVITLTVLLSIFLHGITAIPFSKMFEKKL